MMEMGLGKVGNQGKASCKNMYWKIPYTQNKLQKIIAKNFPVMLTLQLTSFIMIKSVDNNSTFAEIK